MKKILKFVFIILLTLTLGIILIFIQSYGPNLGLAYFSQPIYIIEPSANDAAETALNNMELYGLYADSDNWNENKNLFYNKARDIETEDELLNLVNSALDISGGRHSFIVNLNEDNQSQYIEPTILIEDKILHITLPSFSGTTEQATNYANTIADAFSSDIDGVIINLQDNNGGDMGPMIAGLSPILKDGTLLTFENRYSSQAVTLSNGKVNGGGSSVEVNNKIKVTDIPIAILFNNQTASSAEITLIAVLGQNNVHTFGEDTAGVPTANRPMPINRDYIMYLTTSNVVNRHGKLFEEVPIKPMTLTDTPLEKAETWMHTELK